MRSAVDTFRYGRECGVCHDGAYLKLGQTCYDCGRAARGDSWVWWLLSVALWCACILLPIIFGPLGR